MTSKVFFMILIISLVNINSIFGKDGDVIILVLIYLLIKLK